MLVSLKKSKDRQILIVRALTMGVTKSQRIVFSAANMWNQNDTCMMYRMDTGWCIDMYHCYDWYVSIVSVDANFWGFKPSKIVVVQVSPQVLEESTMHLNYQATGCLLLLSYLIFMYQTYILGLQTSFIVAPIFSFTHIVHLWSIHTFT